MNRAGTKPKEDAALRKVIEEMAIKRDILHGRITCYDWAALGYEVPVNFVIANRQAKDKPICYRRLRVLPDGALQFSQWQDQPFWEDIEQEKIAAAFQNKKGKLDSAVEGLVYEDPEDIHTIRRTEQYTLPQMDKLQDLLISTRDEEWLDVAPPLSVVESLLLDVPEKDRRQTSIICSNLAVLGTQAPRKKLRASLGMAGTALEDDLSTRKSMPAPECA